MPVRAPGQSHLKFAAPTPADVVEQATINKSFCFFFQKEVLFRVLF